MSLVFSPFALSQPDRLARMLIEHELQIMESIAQGMAMRAKLDNRYDYDRTHVAVAVDLHSKLGPRFIEASGMVPKSHVWATDMPVLGMPVESARKLLGPGPGSSILQRPAARERIYVFAVGDSDRWPGDMRVICQEWPTPVIDWSSVEVHSL